jgi:site-specific recombinase XerD
MIMLACRAGLKTSEIIELKKSDIYDSAIIIRDKNNNTARLVDIDFMLRQKITMIVKKSKSKDLYLFNSRAKQKKYTARTLQLMLQKTAEKSGIKSAVNFQILRNSFIRKKLLSGYSEHELMKIMGYSDTQMIRKVKRLNIIRRRRMLE